MTLEFDSVQFSYDERPLLSGIYIKCEKGKVTGLLGRNGSGKSTLMKIVFGAIRTNTLSLRIDGKYIPPPAFKGGIISYLPQDSFIPSDLTLKKILTLYDVPEHLVLNPFPELEEDLSHCSSQLSGGRLRLFEVLLILHSKAPFCFLDEPFTGLTPLFVERLQTVIQIVRHNKGILISDHLYAHVINLSDTLYLLTNGRTYAIKERSELIQRGYLLE